MRLESLLLTRDAQVINILRPALDRLSIDMEVCRGARSGNEILCSEKFDAVIVDCDLQGGLEVLQNLRRGTSNKNSAVFAVLNGQATTHEVFEQGANFVLQKPLSASSTARCFTAALDFMALERPLYFRYPIEIPATLTFGQDEELRATATNLSEGGMAIRFRGKFPKGALSKVLFTLPGTNTSLEPKAQVAWADGTGRAGVRFLDVPQHSREQLDRWLTEQAQRHESSQ